MLVIGGEANLPPISPSKTPPPKVSPFYSAPPFIPLPLLFRPPPPSLPAQVVDQVELLNTRVDECARSDQVGGTPSH